tara:strand:- start:333 stop:608 length:276 start_codon:yes stop_codon:yes gene_type:complete
MEYEVTFEVRSPTAQGKFEHEVSVVMAETVDLAIATVGQSLRNSGLHTRSPVLVRRRSQVGWDNVPYVTWNRSSASNPAGFREDLIQKGGA